MHRVCACVYLVYLGRDRARRGVAGGGGGGGMLSSRQSCREAGGPI